MDLDTLFDLSIEKREAMPKSAWVPLGIDTHIHGREDKDGRMPMVVRACAGEFECIIDIPNVPNAATGEQCAARGKMMQTFVPQGQTLRILHTPLINDNTDPDMLTEAWKRGHIAGCKIFWTGVSNSYGQFITSTAAVAHILRGIPDDFPVTLHAECSKDYAGNPIERKDWECWCISREVEAMLRIRPRGVFIIRHVSDYRTLEWIEHKWTQGYRVYAELSPQYLIQIDDDLFVNDDGHSELQCDCVYWPRPKDARSRKALQAILLRCPPWLIYGSDFALHLHDQTAEGGVKINKWGKAVGGLNFLPKVAKSCLIDFCLGHGKPWVLERLLVTNPKRAYGIELTGALREYVRQDWVVEDFTEGSYFPAGDIHIRHVHALNFLRRKTMHWQRAA